MGFDVKIFPNKIKKKKKDLNIKPLIFVFLVIFTFALKSHSNIIGSEVITLNCY